MPLQDLDSLRVNLILDGGQCMTWASTCQVGCKCKFLKDLEVEAIVTIGVYLSIYGWTFGGWRGDFEKEMNGSIAATRRYQIRGHGSGSYR